MKRRLISLVLALALCISCLPMATLAVTDITTVSVNGLSMPTPSNSLDTTISLPSGSNYTVDNVSWDDYTTKEYDLADGTKAVAGHKYRYDIFLTPKSGYQFPHASGTGWQLFSGSGTLNGVAFTGDAETGARAVVLESNNSTNGKMNIWGYYTCPYRYNIKTTFDAGVESVQLTTFTVTESGYSAGWISGTGKTGKVILKSGYAVDKVTMNGKALTVDASGNFTFDLREYSIIDVTTKAIPKIAVTAAGDQDVCIYDESEDFSFKVNVTGDEGKTVTFAWYECDKDGKVIGSKCGSGQALLIYGIPADKMMMPIYYKCIVTAVNGDGVTETASIVFSAVLYPMGIEYEFPFKDVKETAWYYDNVYFANENGLILGKNTTTTFCPNDNMVWAEAIKLAACMNQLYTDGAVTLKPATGSKWYTPYVEYAIANNIIDAAPAQPNKNITRVEYAAMFARALPDEAFAVKNKIADNAIPDYKLSDRYGAAIYKLYRSGILAGSGNSATYRWLMPNDLVLRCEVAAIVHRMMDESVRQSFTLS